MFRTSSLVCYAADIADRGRGRDGAGVVVMIASGADGQDHLGFADGQTRLADLGNQAVGHCVLWKVALDTRRLRRGGPRYDCPHRNHGDQKHEGYGQDRPACDDVFHCWPLDELAVACVGRHRLSHRHTII